MQDVCSESDILKRTKCLSHQGTVIFESHVLYYRIEERVQLLARLHIFYLVPLIKRHSLLTKKFNAMIACNAFVSGKLILLHIYLSFSVLAYGTDIIAVP